MLCAHTFAWEENGRRSCFMINISAKVWDQAMIDSGLLDATDCVTGPGS